MKFWDSFGWNIPKTELKNQENEPLNEKNVKKLEQMEVEYKTEINELKTMKMNLESRIETLQNELQENLMRNKEAVQKLELQVAITNNIETQKQSLISDKNTIQQQLTLKSDQLNQSIHELQQLQFQFKQVKLCKYTKIFCLLYIILCIFSVSRYVETERK